MENIVTFFTGTTLDGDRWVLSFEGGLTAVDPTPCTVSGNLPSFAGRFQIRGWSTRQGSELRAMLPWLHTSEVPEYLGRIRNI